MELLVNGLVLPPVVELATENALEVLLDETSNELTDVVRELDALVLVGIVEGLDVSDESTVLETELLAGEEMEDSPSEDEVLELTLRATTEAPLELVIEDVTDDEGAEGH